MSRSFDRRQFLAAALAAAPAAAWAQPKGRPHPQEGIDFRTLSPPQPVEDGTRVEVLEFFQYTCPHCFTFLPDVERWARQRRDDIVLRRIPINWDNATVSHTKTYYTLEQMGLVEKLHEKFFREIHVVRASLDRRDPKRFVMAPEDIADFMAANGVDRAQWLNAFNSFSVNTRVSRAGQIWRAYKIDGTPAVGIGGRFVTAPSMVGSREGALAVMDFLVTQAQRQRAGGAAKK
jgi:thiol:disulfide interchange protein DsbA